MALGAVNAERGLSHQLSDEHLRVLGSDLELFSQRSINASHDSTKYVRLPTLSNLQNTDLNIIEFDIAPTDHYLDLKRTQIELNVRIMKRDGATGVVSIPQTADGTCAPSNLLLHSMIERVEVHLGPARTNVSPTDNMYGLRTYIEYLLGYGSDAKSSHLTMAGWYADSPAHFDTQAALNAGFISRQTLFSGGKTVALRGYLNTPIMQQGKLLLNQCGVRIVVHLKPAKYCLMSNPVGEAATHSYIYEIREANLRVCNVSVNPSVQIGHESALAEANARYPILFPIVNHHSIAKGSQSFSYQNLFAGDVPSTVFVVMQTSNRFEGSMSTNCLALEHCNLSRMVISVNGEAYPDGLLETDFTDHDYLDAYNGLFSATNTFNRDLGIEIDRDAYKKGYTVFAFDLSRNQEGSCTEIRDSASVGNVSIDLHFKVPLANAVVMTVIGYVKTSVEITRDRQILAGHR